MIDWLQSHLGMSPQLQTRLLVTVGTIVGLWLVRHFVLGFVYRRFHDSAGPSPLPNGENHAGEAFGVGLLFPTRSFSTNLHSHLPALLAPRRSVAPPKTRTHI